MISIALLLCPAPLTACADRLQSASLESAAQAQDWASAVRRGRDLIAAGQGEQARKLLQAADEADHGQLRTRMWLVRALIEIDYLNDALDLIDGLAAAGHEGSEIDYLYGMAFSHKARKYIRQGVNLSMVGMHFSDALELLQKATQVDPARYADAFLPLAEAAWNSQQLELARRASESAIEHTPQAAAAHFMRAEIAFSQFVVAGADEAKQDEAQGHWQAAFDSFQRSAQLDQLEGGDPWRLARAFKKSGDALLWQSEPERAGKQFAHALGTRPASVDLAQLYKSLAPEVFVATLEEGLRHFAEHAAEEDNSEAGMLWWLGYAQFAQKNYNAAREAFTRSYAQWPEAANSQWYIALSNFYLQETTAAVDALILLQGLDPVSLNTALGENLPVYLPILDRLVAHCVQTERPLDAARLSGAQGNAAPLNARYWNNMGLFYRDAGDGLPHANGAVTDAALQQRYYAKALEGYERALALDPLDPTLLNDTAVILHYCLESNLARAHEMYVQAAAGARSELAREDLAPGVRKQLETALRDSQNNLTALDALLDRRKAAEPAERKP